MFTTILLDLCSALYRNNFTVSRFTKLAVFLINSSQMKASREVCYSR